MGNIEHGDPLGESRWQAREARAADNWRARALKAEALAEELEKTTNALGDQLEGAVDLIRLLPASAMQQIIDDELGTEAARATAAAELTRRTGG